MIFVIRGHIRNSFETKKLYNLIKKLHSVIPDLKIFIHTWNIFANNVSWRKINVDERIVTNETIYEYFDDLKDLIQHIIIDDDTKIQLCGNLTGKIGNSLMPVLGWKNYWYGKYRIIDYIDNFSADKNETVVNCRFDVMNNSNSFNEQRIIDFIKGKEGLDFKKNVFLFDDENHTGIDNIYIGNVTTMYQLIRKFFYELDDINSKHKTIINQEKLAFRVNSTMFDSTRK